MNNRDTIAAIATGLSDSGIGIIRISGNSAIEIGDSVFRSPSGKKILKSVNSHTVNYGYIVDNEKENESSWKDTIIDEVITIVMKAPRSFTGDDTVEIQCHGGVFVMQKILRTVLSSGARIAEPGEFTKRAFLNGKIDLAKAEAVMDIIHSQNEMALSSSIKQLKGSLSDEIKRLRSELIYEIAFIESALDDPEHISLEGYSERLLKKTETVINDLKKLIQTADDGKLIKEGINTVIIGKPNAGKSSFMNLLLGEERSIVTDIAGTTRDVLKESVKMKGINFNIIDTAGIHETIDKVEKIGVERAKEYALDADLILYVVDTSVPLDKNDKEIIQILENKNIIVLLNKSDLNSVVKENDVRSLINNTVKSFNKFEMIRTSAKEEKGIEELEELVEKMFFGGKLKINNEIVITNIRHKEALIDAFNSMKLVRKSINDDMPEDFYSIDLMSAYASLGRIIGEEVDDDLVEEIFSKFCMGK